MMGNQPPGRRERAIERRIEAFELRKRGASYRSIGRALGISEAQAYRDVMGRSRQLAKTEEESAQQVRRLELSRLDSCTAGLWQRVESGDPAGIHAFMRVAERRAALLGLDAARRADVTGGGGGPIQTETTLDFSRLNDEQLKLLDSFLALATSPRGSAEGSEKGD